MWKIKEYPNVLFGPDVIAKARDRVEALGGDGYMLRTLGVSLNELESWTLESDDEFFAALRRPHLSASYHLVIAPYTLDVDLKPFKSTVSLSAPTRSEVESVFELFEMAVPLNLLADIPKPTVAVPRIFIGHGRSEQWKIAKDHLHEQHEYEVRAYEIGSRAGHTIRDILDELLNESDFAILVLTGEDETADGQMRPRQNVVHELGLFQGRLGFSRAIALVEHGIEDFSNLQGIHQIRFTKDNIRETFGDILATLRREFSSSPRSLRNMAS